MHYLIMGNGAAGATAAETIREQDPAGEITLVTAEPYPMYSRPGLAYIIINEIPAQQVFARRPEWYEQLRLNLVVGEAVTLDVQRRRVGLADGRFLSYDRLLIATGARAVTPAYPGIDLPGVVYLDTYDGTQELLKQARRGRRAVVIGGGITAMEMAEGLAHQGMDTHYFLRGDRLWSRVFDDIEGALLAERMREHGVTIHFNTEITEVLGNWRGRVRGVRLKDGGEFKCDLLGVAIGVQPQLDLVAGTPIETDRAILVDEMLRSSVPGIYAAGDCAQVYDRWTGKHMVDILWPSAVAEGRAAGLSMVGRERPYQKGTPFNACLLFGLHVTAIGQVNPRPRGSDADGEVVQHLSRGSSEVWFTYPRHYQSAWAADGPNTVRLVVNEGRIVGALLVGSQRLADPLRYLIEHQIDVSDWHDALIEGGAALEAQVMQFWQTLASRRKSLSKLGSQ